MYLGLEQGAQNCFAERSGMPLSHNVGPSLGGSYTRSPISMSQPVFQDLKLWFIVVEVLPKKF
jgi:hypothetical protein